MGTVNLLTMIVMVMENWN